MFLWVIKTLWKTFKDSKKVKDPLAKKPQGVSLFHFFFPNKTKRLQLQGLSAHTVLGLATVGRGRSRLDAVEPLICFDPNIKSCYVRVQKCLKMFYISRLCVGEKQSKRSLQSTTEIVCSVCTEISACCSCISSCWHLRSQSSSTSVDFIHPFLGGVQHSQKDLMYVACQNIMRTGIKPLWYCRCSLVEALEIMKMKQVVSNESKHFLLRCRASSSWDEFQAVSAPCSSKFQGKLSRSCKKKMSWRPPIQIAPDLHKVSATKNLFDF